MAWKVDDAVIIGYGSMGQRHARNLTHLGARIRAIADPADPPQIEIYKSTDKCLEEHAEDKLVVIASPTYLHAQHAIKALYCGAKALYIEKPMCVNIPDAENILDLAKALEVPVVVGYNFRAHPGFGALINTMSTPHFFFGAYGIDDPTTWPTYKNFGLDSYINSESGGVLWTSASHAVDLAVVVLGQVHRLVASYTEDQGTVILRMFHAPGGVSTLYNKWMAGHDQTSLLTYTSINDSITVDLLAVKTADMHKTFMSNALKHFKIGSEGIQLPTIEEAFHGVEILVAAEESIRIGEMIIL